MQSSKTDLSTYKENLKKKGCERWAEELGEQSKIVASSGKFRPPQLGLINGIYRNLAGAEKNVLVLAAPPASGKTHVVCLVAADMSQSGVKVAIVTPSEDLRLDFEKEFEQIIGSRPVAILTTREFLVLRNKFDVALVDEAHNLRSSFQLNPDIYREVVIPSFVSVPSDFPSDLTRVTTQVLDGEEKEELLRNLLRVYPTKWTRRVYDSRTQWVMAVSTLRGRRTAHLLLADPERRRIAARELTVLISATPLLDDELEFYCGIMKTEVFRVEVPRRPDAQSAVKRFSTFTRPTEGQSVAALLEMLDHCNARVLILTNRRETCVEWYNSLKRTRIGKRTYVILGGEGGRERRASFDRFMAKPFNILLTNSTVYWEGINIKDLGLLIIVEEPNPRPNILDVYSGRNYPIGSVMRSRMIQGLGRIGRSSNQKAVAIVLFPFVASGISSLPFEKVWDAAKKQLRP